MYSLQMSNQIKIMDLGQIFLIKVFQYKLIPKGQMNCYLAYQMFINLSNKLLNNRIFKLNKKWGFNKSELKKKIHFLI